jgi:hypothetical protein
LAALNLAPGDYRISVFAMDSSDRISPPATAPVTLYAQGLLNVRAFPNPWRSDRHSVRRIIFDGLTANTTVKIFTVSGHWVRSLHGNNFVNWDLTNDAGDTVASGIYTYLVTTDDGFKQTGSLVVIK